MIRQGQRDIGRLLAAFLLPAMLLGCQVNKPYSDPSDSAASTQPTGRDLDREGVQLTRRLQSLNEATTRIYDAPDGQFVVDEKQTFDRQGLLRYLDRQDAKHLYHGIVYFVSQGDIKDRDTFLAIKTFCIRRNVNLFLGQGGWGQRKPAWTLEYDILTEVTWIVQSRP